MRPLALAAAVGVTAWLAFTALLTLVGDAILPLPESSALWLAAAGVAAVSAAAATAVAVAYFRAVGSDSTETGLLLGAVTVSVGLALDAVLLAATDFRYPGIEPERTGSLVVVLFLGYGVVAVTPAALAAWRARRVATHTPSIIEEIA